MLDKTIVISNLRRFLVRVSSNSNIHSRSSAGGAEANTNTDNADVASKVPNIQGPIH